MSFRPPRNTSRREFIQRLAVGAVAVGAGVRTTHLGAAEARTPASASGRILGVALLGLGSYATGQLGPALRVAKRCKLAGVVTGTPEKAVKWAADFSLPERNLYNYENFDRIADNREIDIVYVVTPNALHKEFVIRAAKAGKHVIVEKPMAVSVAECDEMIAACRAAGVKLSVGYRLHFDPTHIELKRLARERDFGQLNKLSGGFGFRTRMKTWRQTQALAGGGPEMDVGIYVIQAACIAAQSDPVAITATSEPITRPEIFDEVPETIAFKLEFPNGAVCDVRTSYTESYNRFRAEGDRGWIAIEPAYSYGGLKVTTSRGPFSFTPLNQQAAQMDDFADCVSTGRESIVPGEMGRRDNAILGAMHESIRTGKRVLL